MRRNTQNLNKIHGVLNFLWDIDGIILGGDPVLAHPLYVAIHNFSKTSISYHDWHVTCRSTVLAPPKHNFKH